MRVVPARAAEVSVDDDRSVEGPERSQGPAEIRFEMRIGREGALSTRLFQLGCLIYGVSTIYYLLVVPDWELVKRSIQIGAGLICVAGWAALWSRNSEAPTECRVLGGYVVLMGLYGTLRGNAWNYLASDLLTFGTFFCTTLSSRAAVREATRVLAVTLTASGVLALWIHEDRVWALESIDRFGGDPGYGRLVAECLGLGALLIFWAKGQRRAWMYLLGALGLSLVGLLAVRTATREYVLWLFSVALIWVAVSLRGRRRMIALGSLAVVAIGIYLLALRLNLFVALRVQETDTREEYRLEEARALIDEMPPIEVALGRGLGGTHQVGLFALVEGGTGSAHLGWAHLILKGGVIFLAVLGYTLWRSGRAALVAGLPSIPGSMAWVGWVLITAFVAHTRFAYFNPGSLLLGVLTGVGHLRSIPGGRARSGRP